MVNIMLNRIHFRLIFRGIGVSGGVKIRCFFSVGEGLKTSLKGCENITKKCIFGVFFVDFHVKSV